MIDPFLLVVTAVLGLLLIAANFYILALYCHPDDKGWGAALYCKIIVIISMMLCWSQILLLPLDIANSRGTGVQVDMISFWYAIMLTIFAFISVLLPFAMFMYETDEDKKLASRLISALGYTIGSFLVIGMILMITWVFFRFADIPVVVTQSSSFVNSNALV